MHGVLAGALVSDDSPASVFQSRYSSVSTAALTGVAARAMRFAAWGFRQRVAASLAEKSGLAVMTRLWRAKKNGLAARLLARRQLGRCSGAQARVPLDRFCLPTRGEQLSVPVATWDAGRDRWSSVLWQS